MIPYDMLSGQRAAELLDGEELRAQLNGEPLPVRKALDCKPSADWFDILFVAPSLLTEGSRLTAGGASAYNDDNAFGPLISSTANFLIQLLT